MARWLERRSADALGVILDILAPPPSAAEEAEWQAEAERRREVLRERYVPPDGHPALMLSVRVLLSVLTLAGYGLGVTLFAYFDMSGRLADLWRSAWELPWLSHPAIGWTAAVSTMLGIIYLLARWVGAGRRSSDG